MDPEQFSWSRRMNALGEQDYAMLRDVHGMIQCRVLDLNAGEARETYYLTGKQIDGTDLLCAILGDESVYGLRASGLGDELTRDEMLDSAGEDVVYSLRSVTFQKWHPIECPVTVLSGGHGPFFYVARTSVIEGASIVQDVGKASTLENAVMLLVNELRGSWRSTATMALTIVDPRGNMTPLPGSIIG